MSHRIGLKTKIEIIRKTVGGGIGNPHFASLFITRKCNLTCPYCESINHDYEDVDTEQWFRIIDRLYDWGVRVFSLTGGEPTVRHDIYKIVEYISKTKKSVCWMISNFKKMKESQIIRYKESGLSFLTCSLDSFSQIGVKSESSVLPMLAFAKKQGIVCSTLTVVTKKNIHEIPEILKEVTQRGFIFDMGLYQHVGGIFSPKDDSLKVTDRKALEDLRTLLRSHKYKTGLVGPSLSYLSAPLDQYRDSSWKCSSTKDHYLVVNNDGRLMTCQEYLNNVHVLEIETLKDPLWREEKKKTVEACSGCFYGCYYQKENVALKDVLINTYALLKT